jgi:putative FmdB family regulatory protein
MPLHEYKCENCGITFEVIQKFSDPAVETCRNCGGKVQRLLSAPAIHFKGSGWYVTDYARKDKTGANHDKSSSTSTASADHDKSSSAPTDKPSTSTDKSSASADTKSATPSTPSTTKS